MKIKIVTTIIVCFAFIVLGCSKEELLSTDMTESKRESVIHKDSLKAGAQQVRGIGYFAEASECEYQGTDEAFGYAALMTGDLEGCLYVFIDDYDCSPSGTYRETGREYFVGTYKGKTGTFWTTYTFTGKFEGCAEDGSYLGAEIFGRCQHPIVDGSGTGVFEGVTGRLDFKDDIDAGNFPYRGHLKY
jgi:hypothetical protein